MSLNCVDMSKWGGPLSDTEAQCLTNAGVRLIITGTGHPSGAGVWARQQAESWLRNGGETLDAYIYLYMAGQPTTQVNAALGTLQGLPVRMWWLDAEDTESPHLTAQQRADFLESCLQALGSRTAGIYTGRWWWRPNMGNSTAFAHLPLWNSYYDGDPDTDGLPYGGWVESAIEQYQGTTDFCGQSVDLNFAKNLEDAMTPDERLRMERLELAMFSGKEEASLGRDQRLQNAQFRAALRDTPGDPTGWQVSVSERVEAHIADHTDGGALVPGTKFKGEVIQ